MTNKNKPQPSYAVLDKGTRYTVAPAKDQGSIAEHDLSYQKKEKHIDLHQSSDEADDVGAEVMHKDFNFAPTLSGLASYLRTSSPHLFDDDMAYLMSRVTQHVVERYKTLWMKKMEHLASGSKFIPRDHNIWLSNGTMPRESDGSSLGSREDKFGRMINKESFPLNVPMPPTDILPATIKCPICDQSIFIGIPNDWTNHVFKDLQAYVCTWNDCHESSKIFDKTSDWVYHENVAHKRINVHWRCDVDDCRQTTYDYDGFLQHLVQKHKFGLSQ